MPPQLPLNPTIGPDPNPAPEGLLPEDLFDLATDPRFDLFNEEHRAKLTTEQVQAVAKIRQQLGSFSGGLEETGKGITEGLSTVAENIDPVQAIPAVGGTIGAHAGGPLGAAAGGGIGEIVRQMLSDEEVSGRDAVVSGALSAAPTALLRAHGPIARSTVNVSKEGRQAFPQTMRTGSGAGSEVITTPSERPVVSAMQRFGLRSGSSGAERAQRFGRAARQGAPIGDPSRPGQLISGRSVHPAARAGFATTMDDLARELERQQTADIGGASLRDRIRILLQQGVIPATELMRGLEVSNVDDLVRVLVGLMEAGVGGETPDVPSPGEIRRRQLSR